MSDLLIAERFSERATCHACGKRRMCRMLAFFGTPGLAWMVCREHGDWRPQLGVDYVEASC